MQGGGVVKPRAMEGPPAGLPVLVRAQGAGETHAHVTWLEPSTGMTRLLTALITRGGAGIIPWTAKQRLLDLARTPA